MKQFILALILVVTSFIARSQNNPYAVFGYKPKVEYKSNKLEIFRIKNNDPQNIVKYLEFDFENSLVTLIGNQDSIIEKLEIGPNKLLRWISTDPMAHKREWVSPYNYVQNNPILRTDPTGALDDYYSNRDGTIQKKETNDNFDRFYTQDKGPSTSYTLQATLTKNQAGLVAFPESGNGWTQYGVQDAGGKSGTEMVGAGDNYLKPSTAAALFGVINELRDQGITISLGDMSSSSGSDPWQLGQKHHAGHGHNGNRTGLDVDFRYINDAGVSFHNRNATTSPDFNAANNTAVYNAGTRFGFTRNYQGLSGTIPGVLKIKNHEDHGHLGMTPGAQNIKTGAAPIQTLVPTSPF